MEVRDMLRHRLAVPFLVLALTLVSGIITRAGAPADPATPNANAASASAVARGEYLVNFGSCHDCHTPWKLGPKGPEPDMTRALSGHPSDLVMPPAPALPPGPWMTVAAASMTAWSGPWGVSYTANLTPDKETGLGEWTPEMFIATMRTGRHQGKGRALLPPMPYFSVAHLTDDDIRAVFAYLQSVKPVHNRVPSPIDPPEEPGK
jgi:mono/diheme cytochrome c family protein